MRDTLIEIWAQKSGFYVIEFHILTILTRNKTMCNVCPLLIFKLKKLSLALTMFKISYNGQVHDQLCTYFSSLKKSTSSNHRNSLQSQTLEATQFLSRKFCILYAILRQFGVKEFLPLSCTVHNCAEFK